MMADSETNTNHIHIIDSKFASGIKSTSFGFYPYTGACMRVSTVLSTFQVL